MRAYVFTDGALARHAGRFVWLSIDTEKASSAAFLEKFPVDSWPTLFVIDPLTEKAELKWLGTINVQQLEKLLDDGDYAVHQAWKKSAPDQSLEDKLAAADRLEASGAHADAAAKYEELLGDVPLDWPRRSRLVESIVSALTGAKQLEACARRARELGQSLPHGPSYASVAMIGLSCAFDAPASAEWKKDATAALVPMLWQALTIPELTADDRSSLYEMLIESLEASGNQNGARTLASGWWSFLAAQARAAASPEARAAFDPHRVIAAKKMGEPARVIPILQDSERDLPDDYNAPARLASVYGELGRLDEALDSIHRAEAKAYGPRKLRVLELEAGLYQKKGDLPAALKTLDAALALAQALPTSQRPERHVAKLREMREGLKKGGAPGT